MTTSLVSLPCVFNFSCLFLMISAHLKSVGQSLASHSLMCKCFIKKQIIQINDQYQYCHHFSRWCKTWKDEELSYLSAKCYSNILPLLFIEKLTFPSSILFPVWPNTKSKCQKEKSRTFSPFPISRCYVLCLRDTCFNFLYFSFLLIWKHLKGLLRVLVVFALQQNNKQKSKKRYNFMIGSLLFIMTFTRGKNLWPLTQKWNNDS